MNKKFALFGNALSRNEAKMVFGGGGSVTEFDEESDPWNFSKKCNDGMWRPVTTCY